MARRAHWTEHSAAALLVCAIALAPSGCATHSDKLLPTVQYVSYGDYDSAVSTLNKLLKVDSAAELPDKWKSDRALAVLDRGVLQQSLGRYADSARDISAAEQEVELIDLTKDPVGSLAEYLYSGSSKKYQAPPSERLALNPINLLNYLAEGDLEGAAVEARRFQTMRDYLDAESIDNRGVGAFGAYLAGFTFEKLGEGDRALRYYEEALAAGQLSSLVAPVTRLARTNPYRGERVKELLAATKTDGAKSAKTGATADSELLIVVSAGRVAHKIPERMPIGAAIGLAGSYVTDDLTPLQYGVMKFIVYPELEASPSSLGPLIVRVDGIDASVDFLVDLDDAVRREYDDMKGRIIAAALTRLASRAAIAEGARAAGRQDSNVLGDVLALAIEGALVGLDRPDTRSWTMMPGRVLVARVPVAPGTHEVEVSIDGAPSVVRRASVEVAPKGYAAVIVTEPR